MDAIDREWIEEWRSELQWRKAKRQRSIALADSPYEYHESGRYANVKEHTYGARHVSRDQNGK
jgi:hypothetical protein